MPAPNIEIGEYLYCIIRSSAPLTFQSRSIGGQDAQVHALVYKDLAAVVSSSPIVEYDSTRRNMLAHTTVLEEVMNTHTILPVRFGIVAPDAEAVVEQMLKRRYDELEQLMHKMDGCVELGLKAFWYEEVVYREIVEASPAIRQLRDSLVGKSPEETYYQRIKLGELVESAMKRKREEDAHYILEKIEPLVLETRNNMVITERMVLNAAFLVRKEHETEVDQVVQELDQEMGKRMMFKYVGSAPPYNFVNIVVRWDS
ncbi:GvpL/GvpF family gas vesicle protein [Candidatus Chloroploca asiatica]|uniref:GvpL/GvpF-family gas vesicle protein 1 n=1 Tax=Candidatus Chloroploca asiatica TaxID=1506545 RepID=A0A2H3KZG6_9CHLR|nr:GvpL/GvpF family gas vesicle protein [Candidatus Chloroploca asiatica]PDW01092.1 GvpL/GvpF-family gas vesicle protein 1 [Candidatus Chloroploca asiatica]